VATVITIVNYDFNFYSTGHLYRNLFSTQAVTWLTWLNHRYLSEVDKY